MGKSLGMTPAGAACAVAAVLAAAGAGAAGAAERGNMQEKARAAAVANEANEPGTIPAARPGLPQLRRGAEGPLRGEIEHKADPSVRDTNPLTVNGLWETLPGNVIARPQAR